MSIISGFKPVRHLVAEVFATLPAELRYTGEPTEWVRLTRPGQRLDAFLEGGWIAPDGRLWLVDVPYGRLFSITEKGAWRLEFEYDGEPHAICRGDAQTLYLTDYRHGLMQFDLVSRTLTPVATGVNSERFRGLGDMARSPDGDLWFVDVGRSSLSDPSGRLFRMRNGSSNIELALAGIPYPNGIAFSPDGKFVYLAATRANAVWRFLANAPDPVFPMVGTHIQLSGGLGPDGMVMRPDGTLAVAHAQAGRAYLFDSVGDPIAVITTPGGMWTTSVTYSADWSRLFIVDAQTSSVFAADLSSILPPI